MTPRCLIYRSVSFISRHWYNSPNFVDLSFWLFLHAMNAPKSWYCSVLVFGLLVAPCVGGVTARFLRARGGVSWDVSRESRECFTVVVKTDLEPFISSCLPWCCSECDIMVTGKRWFRVQIILPSNWRNAVKEMSGQPLGRYLLQSCALKSILAHFC